jgi:hypothetical protein
MARFKKHLYTSIGASLLFFFFLDILTALYLFIHSSVGGHLGVFHVFIIILLLYWGKIVTFTKVLTLHHSWIHPLLSFSFIPLPPFLEWFQHILFFHFHTWIHNISTIFILLHPFLISSLLPLYQSPGRTGPGLYSCSLFFVKTHFYFFKIGALI